MENIGSEIGQKMRSAVKAKLLELGTGGSTGYIDDELPDYVMIMVANKRSKQQMTADLNLFLGEQTQLFVTWLHEVLQKLEEVTLPAASVLGKKRKSSQREEQNSSKRDKKISKRDKKPAKKHTDGPTAAGSPNNSTAEPRTPNISSITDVFAEELLQKAKKNMTDTNEASATIKKGKARKSTADQVTTAGNNRMEATNTFDIPTITEMASSAAAEPGTNHEKDLNDLATIQRKIDEAKRHLRQMTEAEERDSDDDDDYLNLRDDGSTEEFNEAGDLVRKDPKPSTIATKRRSPIRFDIEEPKSNDKPPAHEPKMSDKSRRNIDPPPKAPPARTDSKKEEDAKNQRAKAERPPPPPPEGGKPTEPSGPIRSLDRKQEEEHARERERNRERERERERERPASVDKNKRRPIHERLGVKPQPQAVNEMPRERRPRAEKELYVPAFRRQEQEPNREREKEPERDREREPNRGRNRGPNERERERDRERERERERERRRRFTPESVVLFDRNGNSNEAGELNGGVGAKSNSRIGSRVIVAPPRVVESSDDESLLDKPVNSVIKIKPRTPVSPSKQACKNLLLRAMAEAQRSTILTKTAPKESKVTEEKGQLYTKAYRNRSKEAGGGSADASGRLFRRTTRNLVIAVEGDEQGKTHRKLLKQSETIDLEEDYIPEALEEMYVDDTFDYVRAVARSEDERDNQASDGDGDVEQSIVASNTQFVVTLNDDKVPVKYSSRLSRSITRSRSPGERNRALTTSRAESAHNGMRVSSSSKSGRSHSRSSRPTDRHAAQSAAQGNGSQASGKRQGEQEAGSYTPPKALNRRNDYMDVYRKPKGIKKIIINNDTDDEELSPHKSPRDKSVDKRETELRSTTPPLPPSLKRSHVAEDQDAPRAKGPKSQSPTPTKRKRTPIKFDIDKEEKSHRAERTDRVGTPPKRHARNEDKNRDSSHERHGGEDRRKISIRAAEAKKYDNIPSLSSVALESNSLKTAKPRERCKYHPNCTKQFCEFYHPTAPCKSFPNCKYADKCMYSHPKCKFDMACTSLDCNYSHSGVRNPSQLQPTAPPLSSHVVPVQNYKTISVAAVASTTMCKYYPNCTKVGCVFYHPKPCRFGKNCINKLECNFYHHELQSSNKFKWVASMG